MESLEFVVEADEVEFACGLCWSLGVAGIEERDEPDGRVRLLVGVESDAADDAVDELGTRWEVTRSEMNVEAYLDAWRPFARAVRVGERLVIQPPWVDPIARPGDLVVSVDPGRAWGHGAHPTTVLCVEAILRIGDLDGWRVLDIGCGSGVLSVASALLGAKAVVGIDVDFAAVDATLANALVSGVPELVEASTTPVGSIVETFEIVLANIGLGTLCELAGPIGARVAANGILILSGLLVDQVDDALEAYGDFEPVWRRDLDGWSTVALRRRSFRVGR